MAANIEKIVGSPGLDKVVFKLVRYGEVFQTNETFSCLCSVHCLYGNPLRNWEHGLKLHSVCFVERLQEIIRKMKGKN